MTDAIEEEFKKLFNDELASTEIEDDAAAIEAAAYAAQSQMLDRIYDLYDKYARRD